MIRIRIPRAMLLGVLFTTVTPVAARAQAFASTARAQCVGGAIGCQQVDFFVELLGLPTGETWLDYLTISGIPTSWQLAAAGTTEAGDAWGDNFYSPEVMGQTLNARFDLGAVLDPSITSTLRVRAEFAQDPDAFANAISLSFSYEAGAGVAVLAGGTVAGNVSVTPEPLSVVLLATGFLGLGVVRRCRRA